MYCISDRVEQLTNTPMDFADEIGKGGNWGLSMLTDLLTSLSWNFHFQEEIEHSA